MSTGMHADFDEYGMKHFAADLYDIELYSELYEHTTSRDWFDAQTHFDPSRQTYAESLDWALRAAEEDSTALSSLLMLTLLRASISTFSANIPTAALEVMARLGASRRAEAYAKLRADLTSRCEALCRIAFVNWERKEVEVARKNLERAERLAWRIHDAKTQAYALALVGTIAHGIGEVAIYDREMSGIRACFERGEWPAAIVAQEFGLLDRHEYLLALIECDPMDEIYGALATVVRLASVQKDNVLLDAVATHVQHEERGSFFLLPVIVEALTEAGRVDDALATIKTWPGMRNEILQSIARAAGRLGDLETIEQAASMVQHDEDGDIAVDWEDRFEKLLDWGLRRFAGNREEMAVLAAGVEGLAENHPMEARELWSRVTSGRRLRAMVGLGVEDPEVAVNAAVGLEDASFLEHMIKSIHLVPKEDRADFLSLFVVGLARTGHFDRAIQMAKKLDDPDDHMEAQMEIVAEMARSGQVEQAVTLAESIPKSHERRCALDTVAESLVDLPLDQADTLLPRFVAQFDRITKDQSLASALGFPDLINTVAGVDVKAGFTLAQEAGADFNFSMLTVLSKAAITQGDISEAKKMLTLAKKIGEQSPRSIALAEMAVQLAEAVFQEKHPKKKKQWASLANEALRQGMDRTTSLDELALDRILPLLAQAARLLKKQAILDKLREQSGMLSGMFRSGKDLVLIQIAVGLAESCDYKGALSGFKRVEHAVKHDQETLNYLQKEYRWLSGMDLSGKDLFHVLVAVGLVELAESGAIRSADFGIKHVRYRAQAAAEVARIVHADVSIPIPIRIRKKLVRQLLDQARDFALSKLDRYADSAPKAMEKVIEVLTQFGRYDDVLQIAQNTTTASRPFQKIPKLKVIAVKNLAHAGQMKQAYQLLDTIEEEKALAMIYLAGALVSHDTAQARELLDKAVPLVWETLSADEALNAFAEVATNLSQSIRLQVVRTVLRAGREQGRPGVLQVTCSAAPVFLSLMDANQWQDTIEKIIEIDHWWRIHE